MQLSFTDSANYSTLRTPWWWQHWGTLRWLHQIRHGSVARI